jgi:hypothetical protein
MDWEVEAHDGAVSGDMVTAVCGGHLQILHGDGLEVKPAVEIHGGDDVSESGNNTFTGNSSDVLLFKGKGSRVDGRCHSVHIYITTVVNRIIQ